MASVKAVKHRDGTVVWRVRYRVGGKNPVSETFADAASAKRFADLVDRVGGAAAREMRGLDDIAAADTPTVAWALDHHIEALEASATPGTISRYRQIVRDRITPKLGPIPVDVLTRHAVTKWVADMRRTPITRGATAGRPPSAKTIRNAQALLSAALQRLVNEDVIPRNVAKGIPLPKDGEVREMRFLTPDEYARLHAHIPADYQTFVAALYGLGLRFGIGAGVISEVEGAVGGGSDGAAARPIQDGSAWWAAREAIERAHALQDEGRSFVRTWLRIHPDAVSGSGRERGEREGLVNSVLILRDQTVFRFQPRQRRMMAGLLMGATQVEVARQEKVSQQAVSEFARGAGSSLLEVQKILGGVTAWSGGGGGE